MDDQFSEFIEEKYGAKNADDLYVLGKKMKSGVSAVNAVNMMRKLGQLNKAGILGKMKLAPGTKTEGLEKDEYGNVSL